MKRVAAIILLALLMLVACACTDRGADNGEESTGGENIVLLPEEWEGSGGDTSKPSGTQPEEGETTPSGDRWTNFY